MYIFLDKPAIEPSLRLDVLMMSILDKERLTGEEQKNKLKVITILGKFLRKSKNTPRGLSFPTWDREIDDDGFSWLGWTVLNGTAFDIAALIESKQPYDPLLGRLAVYINLEP